MYVDPTDPDAPRRYPICLHCGKRIYSSKRVARRVMAKAGNRIFVYVCSSGSGIHVCTAEGKN